MCSVSERAESVDRRSEVDECKCSRERRDLGLGDGRIRASDESNGSNWSIRAESRAGESGENIEGDMA